MIEKIPDLPAGIDGVRSSGKLTREDYDAVIVPLVDEALRDHRKLRCLVEIPDFAGITPSAAFEDISLGLAGAAGVRRLRRRERPGLGRGAHPPSPRS